MVATAPLEHDAWEICRVYVHPSHHGSGIAAQLLETAERHAIDAGARQFELWTDTRFHRAHRFYEKHSYVRAGAIRALHDIAQTIEYRYAKPVDGVRQLDIAGAQSAEPRLAEILRACVDAGASVSFCAPLDPARARSFWRDITAAVATGGTLLFAAWSKGTLAGTVQLKLERSELGQHRADIAKFLVHPHFRGQGLGNELLEFAEAKAQALGRSLLLLDTKPGDDAERLYRRRNWQEIGRIDGYTRDAEGREDATMIFAKWL